MDSILRLAYEEAKIRGYDESFFEGDIILFSMKIKQDDSTRKLVFRGEVLSSGEMGKNGVVHKFYQIRLVDFGFTFKGFKKCKFKIN